MKYDILSIDEKSLTIKAEANQISAQKSSEINRYGVRRFENEKLFQTSRLGTADQARLIADTYEWGGPGTKHDFGFAPAHTETRKGKTVVRDFRSDFINGLKTLTQNHPDYVFSGHCMMQDSTTKFQSNYGIDLSTSGTICEWYYMYQRKGSGNMIDGYFGDTSINSIIDQSIKEHQPFLNRQGQTVKVTSGSMPVLMVDAAHAVGKLVESLYLNKYEEGAGLYSGKLGSHLFSNKITLLDNGYDPDHGNLRFFDGEGTVRANDLRLIDKGVFSNLMTDLRFGKKFSRASSGNGLRMYNRGVNLGPKGLRFEKGQTPWREIVKNLDRCLVAIVAAGGDSNDLGEYSSPVQIGFVLEKGEVIGQAPQLTVKTSVSDYLGKNLIDVSSDGFTAHAPSACIISNMEIQVN